MQSIINKCAQIDQLMSDNDKLIVQQVESSIFRIFNDYKNILNKIKTTAKKISISYQHIDIQLEVAEQFEMLLQYLEMEIKLIATKFKTIINMFDLESNQQIEKFSKFSQSYEELLNLKDFNRDIDMQFDFNFSDIQPLEQCQNYDKYNRILNIKHNKYFTIISFQNGQINILDQKLNIIQKLENYHDSWTKEIFIKQQMLITAGDDSKINVFNQKNDEYLHIKLIDDIKSYIRKIVITNTFIVCARSRNANYDLFVYQIKSYELLYRINRLQSDCIYMQNGGNDMVVAVDKNQNFYLWKIYLNKFKLLKFSQIKKNEKITMFTFNSNYNLIYDESGSIKILNSQFKIIRKINVGFNQLSDVQILNKKLIMCQKSKQKIYIINLEENKVVKMLDLPSPLYKIEVVDANINTGIILIAKTNGELFKYEFTKRIRI